MSKAHASSDPSIEASFLRSIAEDPANAVATWLVLADWLEERNDPRAELVRLCHDQCYRSDLSPEQRDDRIRALLASGVRPCAPTLTNSIGMTFALIPAGKFLMGSPKSEAGRFDNEGPQHEVEITSSFYLGIFPVTQEHYKKVTGTNPSDFTRKNGGDSNHPVEMVSWKQAAEFCCKLSERAEEKSSGRTYRLPTEAEWEYACRGGGASSMPFHFGISLSSTQANFRGSFPSDGAARDPFLQRTTPVGSYKPNAFGLYDMHGNVWEWCQGWHYPYPSHSVKHPAPPASCDRRVLRGGSWCNVARYCRTAYRFASGGGASNCDGFRLICVAAPGQ